MNLPPDNFEQLRELLILLRRGEIALNVGRKSLHALTVMVNDPDLVAINNIVVLAKETQVSPASITRIAKLLGFSGFMQFQQLFKQRARVRSDYYSQRVKYLVESKNPNPKDIIKRQLKSAVFNVQQCLNNIDDYYLQKAKHYLARASRVFIFGHKQSSAISGILRYGLCLIRQDVHMLTQLEHGIAVELGQLRKSDLVVIFSSSPYSALSIDIASMAKKKSCKVLVITDSTLSPLNDHATISINIPTEGQYYINSLAANCILIESLLSLTAIELGSSAIEKLDHHESLLTQLSVNT